MELTFYPKPQPLLLLPPRSDLLSSPGTHSRLLLRPRLRSGNSRPRRELRGRHRPRAPRCSLAEQADPGSFLAAAAAAVAALVVLPVLCFDSMQRRDRAENESSDVGISGSLENAEPQKQSDRGWIEVQQGQASNRASLKVVTPMVEIEDTSIARLDVSLRETGDKHDNLVTELSEDEEKVSVNNGMIKSDTPQAYVFQIPACSPSEHVHMEKRRGNDLTVLPQVVMDTGRAEISYEGEMPAGNKGESVGVSSLLEQTIQLHATCSAIRASDVIIHMPENSHPVHKMSYSGESHFFAKKGPLNVSTFNEVFHEEARTIDFKCLSQISQQFTLQDNTSFGSSVRPLLKRVKPHTKDLLLSSEPVALASIQEVAGGEEQNANAKSFRRDTGKRFLQKPRIREKSRYPDSEKMPHIKTAEPSLWLSSYNRLLSNGRLHECIELLESSERKGVLDMDKVYHRRFLQSCKTQKAVKEAFRFTKLIKKPTLSTFNMLLSICAKSQNYEGALQVLLLVKDAGLRPDCQLYTTLISTCGKSGKVDAMFEVFHEMVNAGVEPNAHTYGALIDGCARAGQVAKAFGAYGIMRSKDVKPDRVIFNALITACGQSGAVDRAFDVLAEMMAEPQPLDPDHVTVGALMKTCIRAGQADRAREVYKMLDRYNIKGTADVYTIAVNNCSLTGDLEFALKIYDDMKQKGVDPDEMFLSTFVDVAGHAGKVEVGFEILHDARVRGIQLGTMSYSSLMGACSNAKNWQKALELYEEIKALRLFPTVSTLNALITSLCDGNQLLKAVEVFNEMKEAGIQPNIVTYSILSVACERKDEIDIAFDLLSQAKEDGIQINPIMFRCLTGLCQRRFKKVYSLGEPILSFNSGKPLIDSKWTKLALMVYRQTISAGIVPSTDAYSQVLGCLKFPNDISLRSRFVENLGITFDTSDSRRPNLYSLIDGFGEYDPRSFSILEEASSLGVIPCVSFKESPIIVDTRKLQIHSAQVYVLTTLKGLKNRLAAGARLPNVTILVPTNKAGFFLTEGEKTVNLAGRVGQAVGSMLRRLGLPYQGDESYGKLRISGLSIRRWLKPKITFPSFGNKPADFPSSQTRLAQEIANQQRSIRSSYSVSID